MSTKTIPMPTKARMEKLAHTVHKKLRQGKPTYSSCDRFAIFFFPDGRVNTGFWRSNICSCGCSGPEGYVTMGQYYDSCDKDLTLEQVKERIQESADYYLATMKEEN